MLLNKDDRNRVIIVSSKANNKVKFKLSNLMADDTSKIDAVDLRLIFRFHLPGLLQFDAAAKSIKLGKASG